MAAGELVSVWSDAAGSRMGQSVEPLFKSELMSVRHDPVLYDLLALTDALRVGKPRVQAVAAQMLADRMAEDVKPAEPLLQWGHAVVSFGYPALGSTPSSQTGRADPEDVFLGFA
jgi:hypothetical protein